MTSRFGPCPSCRGDNVVALAFGLPVNERAVLDLPNDVIHAGCVVTPWDRECQTCGCQWNHGADTDTWFERPLRERIAPMLIGLALVVRFVSELALLTAFVAWGADGDGIGWLLAGATAAVLVAVVWGRWVAPKAPSRLTDPARYALEAVLFSLGALAAWSVWGPMVAVVGLTMSLLAAWAARSANA